MTNAESQDSIRSSGFYIPSTFDIRYSDFYVPRTLKLDLSRRARLPAAQCLEIGLALTTALGYVFAIPLPRMLGIDPKWGAAGLTASAGIAGWVEFVLLRASLNRRIGKTGLSLSYVARLWLSAIGGGLIGWGIKSAIGQRHPIIVAALVLLPYGLAYFAIASAFRVNEANVVVRRGLRMLRLTK